MRKTADVVVIGGGVVGSSIAYSLLRSGVKDVVLCEKATFADGSTGRCGAGVREQWGSVGNCLLAKASIDIFEHLEEELEYDHSLEFKQEGYLLLAHAGTEWAQFQKNVELQNSLGISSRLLNPREAREVVPILNTDGMLGATFNPRDGHINPFHTTRAYLMAAGRLGGDINFFTEVTGIKTTAGVPSGDCKVTSVITDKGEISAPVVVNAAGPWAAPIGKMVGLDLPVYTQRHQILVTEPVGKLLGPMVMSFSKGIYCQQTPHGSFVMGIGDPAEPKGYDTGHSWGFLHEMARIICSLLPPLAGVRVVRQWSGLYTVSPDAHPILGAVEGVDGYYQAVGFSGHGFMLAPIVGRLIAQLIERETPSLDIAGLTLGRFARGDLRVEPSVV